MKKTIKKLVSTVAAIALFAVSAFSAFAADPTGTITISNATAGENYAAYKIFNADVNGTSVSYTLEGEATTELNQILLGTGSPFELKDGYVTVKADTSDDAIISFLKGVIANNPNYFTDPTTEKATSSTVTLTVPYGYYYVTSGLGTAVSITSVTSNVNIIDKNDMPSWNPEDPDTDKTTNPPMGKLVSDTGDEGTYGKTSTSGINQAEYFMISAHCPKYAGSNLVKSYIFTDTLEAGFTYNDDAELYVNGTKVTTGFNRAVTSNDDGTTTIVYTYTLPADFAGAEIAIKYTATTDKDAVYDNVNKADMDWTYIPYGKTEEDFDDDDSTTDIPPIPSTNDDDYNPTPDDPSTPPTPETSVTDTYVYAFGIKKVDAKTKATLNGAEFKLYSDADCTKEVLIVKVSDNKFRVAELNEEGTAVIDGETAVAIVAGEVTVFGFDKNTTYYLKETKAPMNYNLLNTAITVTIDGSAEVSKTFTVENSSGSTLPSTGGMGTTIFIVAGSVLMVGAFVGIITKKRMELKEEEK